MDIATPKVTKTVLITGGAGYIGQHIVVKILRQGYRCLVVDNLSTSYNFNRAILLKLSGIIDTSLLEFYQTDIRDQAGLENIFIRYQNTLDLIIHLAALKSIPESIREPELYHQVNVEGTQNIINLAEKYGIEKLVFSSTAAVYAGIPSKQGYSEIDAKEIKDLAHPYATTKRHCEYLLEAAAKQNPNMKIVALRYFNPIGNIKEGKIGERLLMGNSTGLMFQLGKTYLGLNNHFSLFGTDYPDSEDGTAMRDFIDVEDLAESHLAVIDKLSDRGYYCFNVGTGRPTSVKKLLDAFQKVATNKIIIKENPRREGDQAVVYANTTLLKTKIGWTCSRTLEQSCQNFLDRCLYLESILKV